jgi:hypothetical protein
MLTALALLLTTAAGVVPFSRQRTASRRGLLPSLLLSPSLLLPMSLLLLGRGPCGASPEPAAAAAAGAHAPVLLASAARVRLPFRGLPCRVQQKPHQQQQQQQQQTASQGRGGGWQLLLSQPSRQQGTETIIKQNTAHSIRLVCSPA